LAMLLPLAVPEKSPISIVSSKSLLIVTPPFPAEANSKLRLPTPRPRITSLQ
jgi:hypothetical protein